MIIGLGVLFLGPRCEGESPERTPVVSSSIASIGYGKSTKALEVEFRSGAIYRYLDVPETVANDFIRAKSKGHYFSTTIRGVYSFQHLPIAKK